MVCTSWLHYNSWDFWGIGWTSQELGRDRSWPTAREQLAVRTHLGARTDIPQPRAVDFRWLSMLRWWTDSCDLPLATYLGNLGRHQGERLAVAQAATTPVNSNTSIRDRRAMDFDLAHKHKKEVGYGGTACCFKELLFIHLSTWDDSMVDKYLSLLSQSLDDLIIDICLLVALSSQLFL